MELAAWAEVVLMLLSAIGAATSWWHSTLSKRSRAEAEDARRQAAKTLEAITRQAEAAERAADAQQRLADQARADAKAPPWRIEWTSGHAYSVINESPQRMSGVRFDFSGDPKTARLPDFPCTIDGHSSIDFVHIAHAMSDRSMTITWTWPDGQSDQWSGPIPRPSPRGASPAHGSTRLAP